MKSSDLREVRRTLLRPSTASSRCAMAEGRLGGEFFTPHSIVRLIVEIIQPFHGRVFDPACGSGGMFVQCAKFVERHAGSPNRELSVYGQEHKEVTVPLAKMNLALHGFPVTSALATATTMTCTTAPERSTS